MKQKLILCLLMLIVVVSSCSYSPPDGYTKRYDSETINIYDSPDYDTTVFEFKASYEHFYIDAKDSVIALMHRTSLPSYPERIQELEYGKVYTFAEHWIFNPKTLMLFLLCGMLIGIWIARSLKK